VGDLVPQLPLPDALSHDGRNFATRQRPPSTLEWAVTVDDQMERHEALVGDVRNRVGESEPAGPGMEVTFQLAHHAGNLWMPAIAQARSRSNSQSLTLR
jgi:hypothetical protein